jgi:pimeloyl-ACP methyl ester carboxylesterase
LSFKKERTVNTNDLLTQWSNLSLDEIEARLVSGQDAEAAAQLLGADSVASMSAPVSFGPPGPREAVVLLPGIMGSLLSSIRGVTTVLWINPAIFLRGQSNYLELNSDGSADYNPAIETVPVGIEKLIYLKLSLALHREMTLFEFPYDWRRPIEWNADILAQSIERWADGDPARRFTLIGHSMGGIVARTYLARHTAAAEQRIKRAVTLGTPHYGAANAIENLVMGNKMIEIAGRLNPNNTADRLLLNLPSFYELFPAPPAQFPKGRAYPANWDVYNAAAWQWPGIRQDYLDLGRRFHELMAAHDRGCQAGPASGRQAEVRTGPSRRRPRCRRRHCAALVGHPTRSHRVFCRGATPLPAGQWASHPGHIGPDQRRQAESADADPEEKDRSAQLRGPGTHRS